jgi:hypothetical protein
MTVMEHAFFKVHLASNQISCHRSGARITEPQCGGLGPRGRAPSTGQFCDQFDFVQSTCGPGEASSVSVIRLAIAAVMIALDAIYDDQNFSRARSIKFNVVNKEAD